MRAPADSVPGRGELTKIGVSAGAVFQGDAQGGGPLGEGAARAGVGRGCGAPEARVRGSFARCI